MFYRRSLNKATNHTHIHIILKETTDSLNNKFKLILMIEQFEPIQLGYGHMSMCGIVWPQSIIQIYQQSSTNTIIQFGIGSRLFTKLVLILCDRKYFP